LSAAFDVAVGKSEPDSRSKSKAADRSVRHTRSLRALFVHVPLNGMLHEFAGAAQG
jgi:hypothetical protein